MTALPAGIPIRPEHVRPHASREAWLAGRGIGASEVAAIRGRSPFAGPWNVWARRQSDAPEPTQDRRQAEGTEDEDLVALKFERRTGRSVLRVPNLVVVHPQFAWATCSPDGFAGEDGVELKTDAVNHGWGQDGTVIERGADADAVLPPMYADQVYYSLEVTGLARWLVAVWLARPWGFPELRVYRVLRDVEHQRRLLLDVALWRERFLVAGEVPDIDASDACVRWHSTRPGPDHKRTRELAPDDPIIGLVVDRITAEERETSATRELRRIDAELTRLFGPETYAVRLPGSGVRCKRVRTAGDGHRFVITFPKETR